MEIRINIQVERWKISRLIPRITNPHRSERDEQDVGSGAHDLALMAAVGTAGCGDR
jgi:hypothetical protein